MRPGESWADWLARNDADLKRLMGAPHYVYRAFDSYGLLLYVGCTNNPKSRLSSHRSMASWFRFAESIGVTGPYDGRDAARAVEAEAIRTEGAYFNATREDITRTQANLTEAKRSTCRRGWSRPCVSDDIDPRDDAAWTAAWEAIAPERGAWDRAFDHERERLKAGAYPYLTDADRLARYLAARDDAELARQDAAA